MKNRAKDCRREDFHPALLARLEKFQERLITWNRKFSLTSVPDHEIFEKLIAPSAWLGIEYSREDIGHVIDFGTGPGVPGVPMALADERNNYLLIDSNSKKIGFIRNVMTAGGSRADNVDLRRVRIRGGAWDKPVDRVVTRGAGSMKLIVGLMRGKIKPGGYIDFFKGFRIREELDEVREAYPAVKTDVLDTPDWPGGLMIVRVRMDVE